MNVKTIGAAVLAGAMIAGCGKNDESVQAAGAEAKAEAAAVSEVAAVAEAKAEAVAKDDEMAVSVNGEKLMQSAIDADVEKVISAQPEKIPAERLEYVKQSLVNQLVQGFIFEKVLAKKAKADGIKVSDADIKAREGEMLKQMSRSPDAPKTLEEFFKKHPLGEVRARRDFENVIIIDKMIKAEQAKAPKEDFSVKAQEMIDNIVSNNAVAAKSEGEVLAQIKGLKAQLDKVPAAELAAKFAEMAKENSACPSSAKGGDLGEFTHGQMVKEFDEVAFKLPVNEVSEPVKTQFGYHLVLVTKKIPAVEAKGDQPAEPEKVQASHILLKTGQVQDVPKKEDVVKFFEKQAEGAFMRDFVQAQIKAAKIEASENYKRFLPPTDEPTVESAPVEKPTEK